ncbi:MAG TPA: GIY-YIG nuclease family protein [Bacteroidia bacterium]|jgi:putative endonuclease|nr:GIY-YIG nuclease family protein [Bacteroidia bacterium]
MYTVYILKCTDDTYYVGWTTDLNDRLTRHQTGMVKYTSTRLPISIVHYSVFRDKYKALELNHI